MSPYLFVYGTLLSSAAHPMGKRLRRESKLVGQATIPGRLYRISHYPGLVEHTAPQSYVTGEVYQLNSAGSFGWIDAYEGIVPGAQTRNEYERVERRVKLKSGQQVTAWVYLYRKSVSGFRHIPDGQWMPT